MNENSANSVPTWIDPDDAPDLSTPEWAEVIARATVSPGIPSTAPPMALVRVRADIVARFQDDGPGWQERIEEVLRKAVGL
ncbi:MAG: BrnA antitoxin family protein [Rubellimicrobium sp.]|nr:BrnA antitoxin family protein [Rubellimicrobium sp.]